MATHQINSEQQIYLKIAEFLREGKKFALAVVMKDAGSTPRKAGTKAIIDEEGSIWGTIGGGLLESDARKMAMEAIEVWKVKVVNLSLGVPEHKLQQLPRRQQLQLAIEEAYFRDVLVFAAAHNEHPITRSYPAAFAPPLISV